MTITARYPGRCAKCGGKMLPVARKKPRITEEELSQMIGFLATCTRDFQECASEDTLRMVSMKYDLTDKQVTRLEQRCSKLYLHALREINRKRR